LQAKQKGMKSRKRKKKTKLFVWLYKKEFRVGRNEATSRAAATAQNTSPANRLETHTHNF